jgi:Domain of unknown function (DUF4386)
VTGKRLTGILLIIVPIVFMALFTLLGVTFNYPAILREPTATVLTAYREGGMALILNWYGMALSAFMLIPLVILVHKYLNSGRQDSPLLLIATTFGVLAGMAQFLGFIRWPFMVQYLAATYTDPAMTSSSRETIDLIFQSFNIYAGVSIGENLGYLLTGLWTVLIAISLLNSATGSRLLGISGVLTGLALVSGVLEPFGVEAAGLIIAVAYVAWAVWLVLVGIHVLRLRPNRGVEIAKATR